MGMVMPEAVTWIAHGERFVEADGAGEADALGGGAEGEVLVGDFARWREAKGALGMLPPRMLRMLVWVTLTSGAMAARKLREDGGRWWWRLEMLRVPEVGASGFEGVGVEGDEGVVEGDVELRPPTSPRAGLFLSAPQESGRKAEGAGGGSVLLSCTPLMRVGSWGVLSSM